MRPGSFSLFVKFYNHIVASVVVLDFFYDSVVGFDAVTAGIAAGHGNGRIDDIAVAAGSFPLDNGYFITRLDESGALHLKFDCSHNESPPD